MGTRTPAIARFAAVLLLLLPLVALATPAENTAAGQPIITRAEGDPPDAYGIGVGDVLEISVWKNPDLTATVPVRPDGRISVPLLGDVQAAGLTPLALKATLTQGYKEYVTAPGVSVVVKEIHSRKVFVTGEVAHPGAYDLQPRTKLMQALTLAGGMTAYARGKVVLLRDGHDGKSDKRFEYKVDSIISGKHPEDNVLLLPGDTLVVP